MPDQLQMTDDQKAAAMADAFAPLAMLDRRPDLSGCNRIQALLNGTATIQQKRRHCVAVMEAAIGDAVCNEAWVEREDTRQELEHFGGGYIEGGIVEFVADHTFTVTLEDAEEVRGFCIDKPSSFSGDIDGCKWTADVERVRRVGRTLQIKLSVTADF